MVSTKLAIKTSFISALIIGAAYWGLQLIITNVSAWMVGLIVFILVFLGMKGWKL